MKISELSTRVGCPVQTIRYYEQQGLLAPPPRSTGNYRIYTSAHADRLRFIRHCRTLDLTLLEIRQLLKLRDSPKESCADVNELLDEHIGDIGRRIGELAALKAHLKDLRRLCDTANATQNCAILRELATAPTGPADPDGTLVTAE